MYYIQSMKEKKNNLCLSREKGKFKKKSSFSFHYINNTNNKKVQLQCLAIIFFIHTVIIRQLTFPNLSPLYTFPPHPLPSNPLITGCQSPIEGCLHKMFSDHCFILFYFSTRFKVLLQDKGKMFKILS